MASSTDPSAKWSDGYLVGQTCLCQAKPDADSTGGHGSYTDLPSAQEGGWRPARLYPVKTPGLLCWRLQVLNPTISSQEPASRSGRHSHWEAWSGRLLPLPPSASGGGKEEIVIDDDEEELEDVDDNEDDDLTPSQLLQRATSCMKQVGNEGEDKDYDPTGYRRSDMIRFLRNPLYFQDSDGAQEVWGYILRLDKGVKPTKHQIDQSPLFKLRPPPPSEEKNPGIIVADYWIDILTEEGALGNCHPKDYHPPAGYGKLYTWDSLKTHCSSVLSAWKDGQAPPSLVLLVPTLASGTQLGGDYGLSNFHKVEACLKKVTRGEKT